MLTSGFGLVSENNSAVVTSVYQLHSYWRGEEHYTRSRNAHSCPSGCLHVSGFPSISSQAWSVTSPNKSRFQRNRSPIFNGSVCILKTCIYVWILQWKRLRVRAPLGINSPANEKLYRAWVLLKAPGHSRRALSFFMFVFFLFFYHKVSGLYMTGRKPSRPYIILLPFHPFSGSFHHFSSLAHRSFTLGDFTHSHICSRLRIIFLLSSSLLAPVRASANFMPGQSLENHQGRWKQSRDFYLPTKNRPEFFIINHCFFSLSQLTS